MPESESPTPIFNQSKGRDELTLDDAVEHEEEVEVMHANQD